MWNICENINLLLTEHEGRTGEYWPEVVTVRTSLHSVRTKTTKGQYSPVRLEQARLVSSLLYGIVFLWKETFISTSGAQYAQHAVNLSLNKEKLTCEKNSQSLSSLSIMSQCFFFGLSYFHVSMKNVESAVADRADVRSCKNRSGGGLKWIHAGVHHRIYGSDGRCILTGRARSHLKIFDIWNCSWFFTTGTGPAEC